MATSGDDTNTAGGGTPPEQPAGRRRSAGTVLAIAAVLIAYAWFGSGGTFEFRRVSWERSHDSGFTERYYAALAEGSAPDEPWAAETARYRSLLRRALERLPA